MNTQIRQRTSIAALGVVLAALTWTIPVLESQTAGSTAARSTQAVPVPVMPRYDQSGALRLPDDYRRWIMVGASLGISYSDAPGDHEMFAHTLMEPTAYKWFLETGTFREGTMFALLLQGKGDKVLPARRGQFAADVHGVEMAVKDSSHAPEGWSYYAFGGMGNVASTAKAAPKATCFSCHSQHAARDHVFLQFYPLLSEAAGAKLK